MYDTLVVSGSFSILYLPPNQITITDKTFSSLTLAVMTGTLENNHKPIIAKQKAHQRDGLLFAELEF